MPMVWTEPDTAFFLDTDEEVYHCHRKGCLMVYHYQIQSDVSSSDWMAFDIRDLVTQVNLAFARSWVAGSHREIMDRAPAILGLETLEEVLVQTEIWYEGETE